MNTSQQQNESILTTANSVTVEQEAAKKIIKEKVKQVETPLMRYFDLIDDSSPSYVLGYN
jgi:hypothetical protein